MDTDHSIHESDNAEHMHEIRTITYWKKYEEKDVLIVESANTHRWFTNLIFTINFYEANIKYKV